MALTARGERPPALPLASTSDTASAPLTAREPPRGAWFTPREASSPPGESTLRCAANLSLRLGANVAPNVRPGGKAGETTAHSQREKDEIIAPTPRTPPPEDLGEIRRRHRRRTRPGEATKLWVLTDAQVPDPGEGYGIKSCKAEGVAQNFKSGQKLGVEEYMISRGEAVYQSTTREPLGKSFQRGHALPAETKDKAFPGFGFKQICKDPTAKECVFPRGYEPETKEAEALYRKTHGSFAAGQQSRRSYEWPKVIQENPTFRFGSVDTKSSGLGAKSALTTDHGDEPLSVLPTNLVQKQQEHFWQVARDHLGTSRSLLQTSAVSKLPSGHAFGMKSQVGNGSAGELIRGTYTKKDQLPDDDLGRCSVPGRRNYVTKDPLGLPSVRYDVVAPPVHKRSVTNTTNYGDDPRGYSLIWPFRFQFQGIFDEDFKVRRPQEELQKLLEGAATTKLEPEDSKAILDRAVELHADGFPTASLEALMVAYTEYLAPSG